MNESKRNAERDSLLSVVHDGDNVVLTVGDNSYCLTGVSRKQERKPLLPFFTTRGWLAILVLFIVCFAIGFKWAMSM